MVHELCAMDGSVHQQNVGSKEMHAKGARIAFIYRIASDAGQ
jgi:hypothetical protein